LRRPQSDGDEREATGEPSALSSGAFLIVVVDWSDSSTKP